MARTIEFIIIGLPLFALFGGVIYHKIYQSKDHWKPKDGVRLRRDSRIIDCASSISDKTHFKTVVKFDDGFMYISYDTIVERESLHYNVMVTTELKSRIQKKAINKHNELIRQKNQTQNASMLSDKYNEEVQKVKGKPNYQKMFTVFQTLYKSEEMVKQECFINDLDAYNRIDFEGLWGVVLCIYLLSYKPDKEEDRESDYLTLIDILTFWFWKTEGNEASARNIVDRIIGKEKVIQKELLMNDKSDDENYTEHIMAVVSHNVFNDKNDSVTIKKHYDYCHGAIKYVLDMIDKINNTSTNNC